MSHTEYDYELFFFHAINFNILKTEIDTFGACY